jgi:hypothetical protein
MIAHVLIEVVLNTFALRGGFISRGLKDLFVSFDLRPQDAARGQVRLLDLRSAECTFVRVVDLPRYRAAC